MHNNNPYQKTNNYANRGYTKDNNPYQKQNLYSNNNQNNNMMAQQRQLQKEQEQKQYKMYCEQAFDMLVQNYKQAKNNQTKFIVDESLKASITRYFKRYLDSKFFINSLFVLLITFILSFFTKFAVFSILVVYFIKLVYSQNNFCRYFLNDHDVSKMEIKEIEKIIFKNVLDKTKLFFITITMMIVSYIVSFYSFSIFFNFDINQKLLTILTKIGNFSLENELFAYINIVFIIVLMIFKTIEKWSK